MCKLRYRKIREKLSERQNHRCCYCGVRMQEIINHDTAPSLDHIQPRIYGGRFLQDNLVVACRRCNQTRGCENAIKFFNRKGWIKMKIEA